MTIRLSEVAPRLGQGRPPTPDSFTARSPRSASRLRSKRRRSPGSAGVVCPSLPRSGPGTHPPDDEAGTRFSEQPGGQFQPRRPVPRNPSQANRARGPQPREVTPSPSRQGTRSPPSTAGMVQPGNRSRQGKDSSGPGKRSAPLPLFRLKRRCLNAKDHKTSKAASLLPSPATASTRQDPLSHPAVTRSAPGD